MTGNDGEPGQSAVHRFRKPLVEYLISGLEQEDKWVRILAADMLGNTGDPRALDYLKPLLADRDRDLRTVSAQAVETILSRQGPGSCQDPCSNCMIRIIAEEALVRNKPRAVPNRRTG